MQSHLVMTPVYSIETLYKIYLQCNSVSTDTRSIGGGDLFFALKGPTFNGNQYAADALKKGALAVVIDEEQYKDDERFFLVPDVLEALQQLAQYHRRQLNIPVIAIAGSNGKTTTKELMREVLQTTFTTFATQGNLNNEIGVPLSLLKLTSKTEIAVIEMGAKHRYDIQFLCNIAEPTHGIITNTGKDHLESFKTLENTRKTNAELYESLEKNGGTAFVNIADDDLLKEVEIVSKRVTYGKLETADYFGKIESFYPLLSLSYRAENKWHTIHSKLTGKYNFENIMAAVALGKQFHVPDERIIQAVESYLPTNNRSQLLNIASNTFILDAYNANPTSMKEALENLAGIPAEKKVAILGDMLELGEASHDEHFALAKFLQTLHLHKIILVGPEFGKVRDAVSCVHFLTTAEAKEWFSKQHFENTTFLLKGSRGIAVERLLDRA